MRQQEQPFAACAKGKSCVFACVQASLLSWRCSHSSTSLLLLKNSVYSSLQKWSTVASHFILAALVQDQLWPVQCDYCSSREQALQLISILNLRCRNCEHQQPSSVTEVEASQVCSGYCESLMLYWFPNSQKQTLKYLYICINIFLKAFLESLHWGLRCNHGNIVWVYILINYHIHQLSPLKPFLPSHPPNCISTSEL